MSEIRSEITSMLKARYSCIWLLTSEEERTEGIVMEAGPAARYGVEFWDSFDGVTDMTGEVLDGSQAIKNPLAMLDRINKSSDRKVYVLRDLHRYLNNGQVVRAVKSTARAIANKPSNEARTIIILTPNSEVPEELNGTAVVVEVPLPKREEMSAILDNILKAIDPEIAEKANENGNREASIDAALGLMGKQAENCFAKSLVATQKIDPGMISEEKKRAISMSQGLEWIDPDPRGMEAVAGLERVKKFSALRRRGLTQAARDYGLPAPKGVMLAGVPGCGKSLTAKAIASDWKVPLLRLSLADSEDMYVGGSAKNLRAGLDVAELLAPCVLHIDEIEKAVSGATGPQGDGGVAKKTLGSLLTWLQEKTAPVFVVATANDVESLPAELLRKGRFDELFFVDLPTAVERRAILEVTLRQYGRDPETVGNLDSLVESSEGWSGSELAAIVPEALYAAFDDDERELTVADLEAQAAEVVPLSETARERIDAIREWSKGRARPASDPEVKSESRGRAIDLSSE